MALTRVSRHIIDDPFNPTAVSATDVTTTNINASGIGTVGTLRVTGDLTVEGTTTTLDSILTEVDRLEVSANSTVAAGIITQTGSGDILNLYDGSTEVLTVTDGGKVGIGTITPGSRLHLRGGGQNQLKLESTQNEVNLVFTNSASTNNFVGTQNSDMYFYLNGASRLWITSDGKVGINQTSPAAPLSFASATGQKIELYNSGSNNEFGFGVENSELRISSGGNSFIAFRTGGYSGTERLRIFSDGKVRVPDGGKFVVGDGDDLQIFHGSNLSYVVNYTGELLLVNHTDNGDISIHSDNGSGGTTPYFRADGSTGDAILYHYGTEKLATKSTGIQVTGQIDIGTTSIYGTGDISMGDSDKLRLGGGDDLEIYHDGNNSAINDVGTGNLYIQGSDSIYFRDYDTSENHMVLNKNGSVELYHNGSLKLSTAAGGVNIAGNLNLNSADNYEIRLGANNDLKLYHNATDSYIDNATGDFYIRANGDDMILRAADNISIMPQNGENGINVYGDGPVDLYYDNYHKFQTTATGAKVLGALEVTQEYPTIRPILDLNFAATKTLDRRITFTRDGVGSYIDENGILKYASNNTPRFDHDPVTGESLGLLIEESRTNILYGTPSQSYTVNTYNLYNSLTGEYNATRLAKNASGNDQSHGSWNWNGNLSTTSFVMSVFVKKINHASFFMQVVSSGVGDNLYVYYNIDTGVTSFTDYSSPGNLTVTRSIENYPDGWFRLIARVEGFSNAALHSGFRFGFAHPSNNSQQYQDSSDEVLVFGAQAEVGDFATSYIPTHESATSVTRGVDTAIIKGTNFTDFYSALESTIFFESGVPPVTNSKYFTFHGSDGGGTELIEAAAVSGPGANIFTYANSTVWSNAQVTDAGATTLKYAAGIKANDINLAVNGTLGTTDTSSQQPDALDKLIIGNYSSGNYYINTSIKKLSYYNKRLPNAQLQGLTQQ